MSQFSEAFKKKEFVVTAEVGPPKGTDVSKLCKHIELLKDKVDALNVTDNQSSFMYMSSLGGCYLIKKAGAEAILQMSCRDRNRLAIQSDLLSAWVMGIENILCISGDHISLGDHPNAKQVYDLDSIGLIHLVKTLNSGYDLAGNKLSGKVNFFIGAVATPTQRPLELMLMKLRKKVESGAQFLQTQPVYELEVFEQFMEHAVKLKVKVLAGVLLLTSYRMAKYLNEYVAGVHIPQRIMERLETLPKGDQLKFGIDLARSFIYDIRTRKLCSGFHIMAIGKEEVIPQLLS